MTLIALYICAYMTICWLFGRATAIIVACCTVSSTTGIVCPGAAYEGCSGVTGAAIQSGCDMGGVGLGVHTLRCIAIMAGCTVINDTGMVEASAFKASGCMTDTAVLVGWYMGSCFTPGVLAIMAGSAVVHDANMVKGCRYKASGLVAVNAVTVGWHMVRWRRFSSGGGTIVASSTAILDVCVIIFGTGKGRGVMT
jgi:hypothetical protein